ncbi:MAG: hypothetical protein M1495_09000 [Bacteroidetes bacterium]|nr:hypothetical protein [Bacteroidota bacterium]
MKSSKQILVVLCLIFVLVASITIIGKDLPEFNSQKEIALVNPSHLDELYEEIIVDGKKMAIIHIYSDYPEYRWVEAKGEGIACIDDVARAAVFYSMYYKTTGDKRYLLKVKLLNEFILHMQSESGYFYNFIQSDYSINKTFKTSIAQPDWWSWRAVWALSETYKLFSKTDTTFSGRLYQSMNRLFAAVKKSLPLQKSFKNIGGFERPTWLQAETGADQTSILVLALVNYLKIKKDTVLLTYLEDLCDGIIRMQEGGRETFPYGAFMSWENLWHAYGNLQSYALLKAYSLTHDKKYKFAALSEINNFYPYLIKENFLNYFSIKKNDGKIVLDERKQFSQIAYGIRPMVFASLEAAKVTGKQSYAKLAGEIGLWFFGKNAAGQEMYSTKTGLCYDGINSEKELNKNSGAESTIEALLSLLTLEQNKTSAAVVKNFLERK